jgi:hypothetical protein
MTKLIQTYLHDGRLTRPIEILPESELRTRAERLIREGRMPSKEQVEEVLRSVLGPRIEPKKGM